MNLREVRVLLDGARDLGLADAAAPAEEADWQAGFKAGGGLALRRAPAGKLKAFSTAPFGEEALRKALGDFAALCPVRGMEIGRSGWALMLAPGTSWPAFLRCDIAAGFAGAAALHLLLRDRPVVELRFDGEALWAWVS